MVWLLLCFSLRQYVGHECMAHAPGLPGLVVAFRQFVFYLDVRLRCVDVPKVQGSLHHAIAALLERCSSSARVRSYQ